MTAWLVGLSAIIKVLHHRWLLTPLLIVLRLYPYTNQTNSRIIFGNLKPLIHVLLSTSSPVKEKLTHTTPAAILTYVTSTKSWKSPATGLDLQGVPTCSELGRSLRRPNMSRHYFNPPGHDTTFSTPLQVMYWNGVYYPNWRIYRDQPPVSLNYDVISHVFYAFAWVKDDGTVYLSDEWADAQIEVPGTDGIPATQGCLNSFALLKRKYTKLRVVLSVGGGGKGSEPFAGVARDPACRERFAQSSLALVQRFGIDGIDIDWEHPSDAKQGQDYIALLAALRQYLPAPQYTLSSALPAGEWALQHINLAHASQYLDMVNLMAYDYSGPWVSKCGHQAQLFTPPIPHSPEAAISCHSAVTYMMQQGVPRQKIVMGVPAYGRSFTGTRGIGHSFSGQAGEEGTFEYRDLPRPGAKEHVDEQLGAAYCIGGDGGLVTYDNPHTVKMKANYVRQHGLGGLFYWTGTGDASSLTQKDRSLVYNGFLGLFPQ